MIRIAARLWLVCSLSILPIAAHAADFQQPTPEELGLTSEPAAPDAAAIYLYREEIADDLLHEHSVYVRLKILSEAGKKYADVEIPYEQRRFSIASVAGRTIHSDGTVIAFTGKPYDKMLVKTATFRYSAKVFSMPDVQVGSILEYRYQLRYDDKQLLPPTWFIQNELYIRKAHFRFNPYGGMVSTGRDQLAASLMWMPVLPKGVTVQHVSPPAAGVNGKVTDYYVVDLEKIPPVPNEEYLPPIHSLTYRVYFQYSPYSNRDEFWKKEGKYWAGQAEKFEHPGPAVNEIVQKVTAPSDTPEQKLRKLYAEVMTYENTDYTRERSHAEDKAEGLKQVRTADDIATRKRGDSDDLTELFIAMVRSAGLKADAMKLTSRKDELFNANVLRMDQLDTMIAIVNVGGKDVYLDPGSRYCAFGQLRWDHTMASGIRQVDGGAAMAQTPAGSYIEAKTIRVARLSLDLNGQVDGSIQVGYTGDPALAWRQRALTEDQAEVEKQMEDEMRRMLPGGLTVKLNKVLYLDDPSKQLVSSFEVQGPLANATSKRMFVPVEIFEANTRPKFSQPKRENPIYFPYGHQVVDQITFILPAGVEIESTPSADKIKMDEFAVMQADSEVKGNTIRVNRTFALGTILFKPDEYEQVRTFYNKVNHKDQEQAVLKVASHAAGN